MIDNFAHVLILFYSTGTRRAYMDKLLTTADAARLLTRSVDRVRGYEREGRLPALRTLSGVRLFQLHDVEKLAGELAKSKVSR